MPGLRRPGLPRSAAPGGRVQHVRRRRSSAVTVSLAGRRAKGGRAEREVMQFLRDHLGDQIVRTRSGASDDRGDLAGLEDMVVQVKDWVDTLAAVREGLRGAAEQKQNAGVLWASVFVRRRGGQYFVCMSPEDWVSLYREAVFGLRP